MLGHECVVVNMALETGQNHLHNELEVRERPSRMRVIEARNKTPGTLVAEVEAKVREVERSKGSRPPVYVFGIHPKLVSHLLELEKRGVTVNGVIMSLDQLKRINSKLKEENRITSEVLVGLVEKEFNNSRPRTRLDR